MPAEGARALWETSLWTSSHPWEAILEPPFWYLKYAVLIVGQFQHLMANTPAAPPTHTHICSAFMLRSSLLQERLSEMKSAVKYPDICAPFRFEPARPHDFSSLGANGKHVDVVLSAPVVWKVGKLWFLPTNTHPFSKLALSVNNLSRGLDPCQSAPPAPSDFGGVRLFCSSGTFPLLSPL